MDVAADKDGVAKVVYVQDADVSGAGTVYFAHADENAKLVKDSEVGNYFEIDAVVDGEVVTLNVKEGSTAADRLIENIGSYGVELSSTERIIALDSITENADGLVTSVSRYDAESDGDGFITGTGTGKAENETVKLNSANKRFAWDDEVVVVRYDYKGDFSTSRISSIKDDGNDDYVAVLDSNVITGICIVENDGGEGQGQGSEIITEGDVSYEASISSRGNATITFEVTRPEYVPADSTVTITGDLFVNGKDDGTAIKANIAANKDSVRVTQDAAGIALTGFDSDDKLTVENLTVSYEKVTVKYVNGDTSKVLADSVFSALDKDMKVNTSTSESVKFTLKTNTTTVPALTYKVTGLATAAENTTYTISNNSQEQTLTAAKGAKGDNFVTVTIYGLSGLNANETYTISNGNNVNGDPLGQLVNGTGAQLKNLDANLSSVTDKLTITATKTSGIKAGEKVGVTLSISGVTATDVVGYTFKVNIGGTTVTAELKDTTGASFSVPVNGNITIGAEDITIIPSYKLVLKSGAISADGKTATLTFNQAVDRDTVDLTALGFTAGNSRTTKLDESSISFSNGDKTISVSVLDGFGDFSEDTAADKFQITDDLKAADKTFGAQDCSANNDTATVTGVGKAMTISAT